jgi:MoxR-like ATPase
MYTINQIKTELNNNQYIAGESIHYAIFTALATKKPLFIDGPPGVGKTELAKVLRKMLEAELIRLQCYEGMDVSKVIYDINYPKQLLYQNILKENIVENLQGKSFEESVKMLDSQTNFYGSEFIIERPLLKCINPENKGKKVLLIDELDKADLEIEAFLLETLSDYSVSIPEYGTITADPNNLPVVVITSNNQRELSGALKRRCVYLHIDYPSIQVEAEIILRKANTSIDFANQIARLVNGIRNDLKLKQNPSISESIEWANILFNHLDVHELTQTYKKELEHTLSLIAKNEKDVERIRFSLDRLLIKSENAEAV